MSFVFGMWFGAGITVIIMAVFRINKKVDNNKHINK